MQLNVELSLFLCYDDEKISGYWEGDGYGNGLHIAMRGGTDPLQIGAAPGR
jgi:hypothetical protein